MPRFDGRPPVVRRAAQSAGWAAAGGPGRRARGRIAAPAAAALAAFVARSAVASIPTPPPPTPTPPPVTCVAPFRTPDAVCPHQAPAHTCIEASGGMGCFDVSAPPECCWSTIVQPPSGLTLTSGFSACGNAQVCYHVQGFLSSDVGRTFLVQVGDAVYRVGQRRPGTPTWTATPTRTASAPITPVPTSTAAPTATPTVAETPSPSTPTPPNTATCAPTGTPYCLDACPAACAEIRPGCLAEPCGRCFENPRCGDDEACVPPGQIGAGGCCSCATVTPSPSPSPLPTPCPGDCDGDGEVRIDELLRMLTIVLQPLLIDGCRRGDADADGAIDVAEIVLALTRALTGCGAGEAAERAGATTAPFRCRDRQRREDGGDHAAPPHPAGRAPARFAHPAARQASSSRGADWRAVAAWWAASSQAEPTEGCSSNAGRVRSPDRRSAA